MKLSVFNQGLNTRLSPDLVDYKAAISLNNVDLTSEQLKSVKGKSIDKYPTFVSNAYFNKSNETLYPSADVTDYLEYQDKLYFTDGSHIKKEIDGVVYTLGIEAPTYTPQLSKDNNSSGKVNGIVQYVYTYYSSIDGTESQPSPISTQYTLTDDTAVAVLVKLSENPQVDKIFIYRVGDGITVFTKLGEINNSTLHLTSSTVTYLDILAASAVQGNQLLSEAHGYPPRDLKYLTEAGGVFFGAVDAKLYFSLDLGNPNYWPATNYLDFNADITGLAQAAQGLLIFTKFESYLLVGSNILNFTLSLVSKSQGCLSHKSIVNNNNTVFFVSNDGVCLSTGSEVKQVTKHNLGKQLFNTKTALLFDEVYYLLLTDNTILTIDSKYGNLKILRYDFNITWIIVINDVLYGENESELNPLLVGDYLQYEYLTPILSEGSLSNLKTYNSIYVSATGTHTIDVFISGKKVTTLDIVDSMTPQKFTVPLQYQRGVSIQFKCTGIGTIREIEYKVKGRENA